MGPRRDGRTVTAGFPSRTPSAWKSKINSESRARWTGHRGSYLYLRTWTIHHRFHEGVQSAFTAWYQRFLLEPLGLLWWFRPFTTLILHAKSSQIESTGSLAKIPHPAIASPEPQPPAREASALGLGLGSPGASHLETSQLKPLGLGLGRVLQ